MSFVSRAISRFGTYSIAHAINAGLDLEMPGMNKLRTFEHVRRSIEANKLTVPTIKERAKKVLELIQKCAKEAPEVCDGNPPWLVW
jgi:beta-glucosidase